MRLASSPSAGRRTRAAVLTALAAALGAACGSDPTGSVPVSPAAGTYTLRTINGNDLPATYQITPAVTVLLADTLRLSATGSYTEVVLSQTSNPGQAPTKTDTLQLAGTYVEAGSTITLQGRGSATFSGGNTLTLVAGGNQGANGGADTEVYVKQGQ